MDKSGGETWRMKEKEEGGKEKDADSDRETGTEMRRHRERLIYRDPRDGDRKRNGFRV